MDEKDGSDWFVAPRDLGEAIDAVASGGRVLAGGTDLVASMNLRGTRPDRVVWLGRLGMDDVQSDPGLVRIGAGTSLATLAAHPAVRSAAEALADAAGRVAGPAVRNLATLGGSLCAAWPRSDVGCAALGLDGTVLVAGPGGQRSIPMSSLYVGERRVSIAPDEILIELHLRPAARSGFAKIGRRSSMTLAVVNAAVRLAHGQDDSVEEAVVAVGVGHVPQRAPSVEAALLGRRLDPEVVRAAADRVLDDVEPVDDEQASSWYRTQVAPVAVRRALASTLRSEVAP